jgi:hypothetical protein
MNPEEIRKQRLELFKDDPRSDKQLPLMAEEIRERGKAIKVQIYETAQVLTEAKDLMEHGKFKSWIRDQEFDFSYQTANNFMNVYRTCLGRPDLVQTIPASLLYQIASSGFPKDLREFILENADGLKKIKNKEIRNIQKRFKKKELSINSREVQALVEFREKNKQARAYAAEVTETIVQLEDLSKIIAKRSSTIAWPPFPGKDRTELTEKHAQQAEDLINDMIGDIENLRPTFKRVKRILPQFVVPGK